MRKGTCKHFNGDSHNKVCDAGVCYRDVTPKPDAPGSAFRKPCDRLMHWQDPSEAQLAAFAEKGTCDKYEEPTADEIKKHEAKMEAAFKSMESVFPLIKRIKKEHRQSWRGIERCPVCGNKLHLVLNHFDGIHGHEAHCHGKCETDGCVSWSE